MKRQIVPAAIAAAILSSPAMAQGSDESRGMYVALKTGLAALNDPAFTISDTGDDEIAGNADDTSLVTKLETDNAWGFAGEVGYDTGRVRFGLEVRYQRNEVDGLNFRSRDGTAITSLDDQDVVDLLDYLEVDEDDLDLITNGTTLGVRDGSVAKLRQVGVMANVYYDLPLGAFEPYIGAGAGAVGTHLK